jgi:hypothetical protein
VIVFAYVGPSDRTKMGVFFGWIRSRILQVLRAETGNPHAELSPHFMVDTPPNPNIYHALLSADYDESCLFSSPFHYLLLAVADSYDADEITYIRLNDNLEKPIPNLGPRAYNVLLARRIGPYRALTLRPC